MINPYPGLPEFDYVKPDSLAEASQFLAAHAGEARPLMAETDIFVRMRDRVMNQVIASPDVKNCYPLLAEAAAKVASYQLRTRATIVGNICNASPAGDTIGACILLGSVRLFTTPRKFTWLCSRQALSSNGDR